MAIWNDNEAPLAYLITVRTYGTWLHGDDRGSVDRFMNSYRGAKIPSRPERKKYNERIMHGEPVVLGETSKSGG